MKKRSLVSAIAMLVVSALVLTTATFAWFASGSSAEMTAIQASVSASDGSLLISADGGTTWKTTVAMGKTDDDNKYADYGDFTSSTLLYPGIATATAGQLTPVSVTPVANSVSIMGGNLEGTTFTGSTATSGYVKFTVKVKSTADAVITVSPSFSTAFDFGYAFIQVDTQSALYGNAASRQYYPVASSTGSVTGTDGNGNSIMDSGEGVSLAAQQTTVAQTAFTINATAETVYDVVVYMWAEGNDAACTGATGGTSSFGLSFSKTAPSA